MTQTATNRQILIVDPYSFALAFNSPVATIQAHHERVYGPIVSMETDTWWLRFKYVRHHKWMNKTKRGLQWKRRR